MYRGVVGWGGFRRHLRRVGRGGGEAFSGRFYAAALALLLGLLIVLAVSHVLIVSFVDHRR